MRTSSIVIWALNAGLIHEFIRGFPLKIIVPPYHNNANLNAQKGVMSYWEVEMPSKDEEDKMPMGGLEIPISLDMMA